MGSKALFSDCQGKRALRRPVQCKNGFSETECEGVDWIQLAQERVNTVMYLLVL